MSNIAVIDYGLGNTKSICSAIEKTGANVNLTNNRNEILLSDGIILPGVGAFSHGMDRLKNEKIDILIKEFVETGKPLLGICLGMQMLFDSSEEFGYCEGIGYIQGDVKKLKRISKLPHISWSEIQPKNINWENSILDKINSSGYDSLSKEDKDFLFKNGEN